MTDIAVDDCLGALADTRQEHLDLGYCRILRFIQNDEGTFPRPPPHDLKRDHFDIAIFESNLEGGNAHPLFQGFDDRRCPRGKFFFHRAGEKSQRASARDIGTGDNDFGNLTGAELVCGMGRGNPCFTCASGTNHNNLGRGLKSLDIVCLRLIEGNKRWFDTFGKKF